MKLGIIFRNLEGRLIDGYPIEEPERPIRIAAGGRSIEEMVEIIETESFQEDMTTCIEKEALTRAFINKSDYKDATKTQIERMAKVMDGIGLKFIITAGHPLLNGGGLFQKSIIFL